MRDGRGYGTGPGMRELEHFSPETLDEAAALLMAADSRVAPRAEGTDLIAEVTDSRRSLSIVLDLKRIPELNRLEYDERQGLRIGSAVPLPNILEFSPVRRLYPIFADASSPAPPDMGQDWTTLGENLGAGGSSAELAPPLICLRASAAVFGPHGWSELAVEALYAGAGRPVLQPGEFVVDVRLPAPLSRSNGAYARAISQDRQGSVVAGVGALLVMEPDLSTCCGSRLTFCGVTPTPMRALEVERFLSGKSLGDAILNEVGDVALRNVREISGASGGALDLVKGLAHRAVREALGRVRMTARG